MSPHPGFSSSTLLFFLTSLTPVRGSAANDSPSEPPHSSTIHGLRKAGFVAFIVFAVLTFFQLLLIAWPRPFMRKRGGTNTPGPGIYGAEREGPGPGIQRGTFQLLMGFALVSFILKYSIGAYSFSAPNNSSDGGTGYGTVVAYVLTTELADEFLFVVWFMLLTTCTLALERQQSRNGLNIPYEAVLIILMVLFTIARTLVVGLSWNAGGAPGLAQFVLYQMHVLMFAIASIYFTGSAISMWRRQGELALEPLEAVDDRGTASVLFDTLRRIVKHISPLLCILAVYKVVSDVLWSIGVGGNPWVLSVVNVTVEGLIYFLLIFATLSTGFSK